MTNEDAATQVREGEELDLVKIEAYLKGNIPGLTGALEVQQFPGGASNLTYLIKVGDTELVLRRPPFGSTVKSAHDMGREYKILSKLQGVFPQAPKPLAFCTNHEVMGCDFYVMRRLHGIILRRDLPKELTLSEADARQLCMNLMDTLIDLHQVDYKAAGLADFGKPEGYVARQISGWNGRYVKAKTDDVPGCEKIMQWLDEKQPGDSGFTGIIHNDYKFDNVVLDADDPLKIIGVLDWEMTTLGDPLMDLGCTLSYWVQADDPQPMQMARMLPTHVPGMMTRQELLAYYSQKSGVPVEHFDFYYVFGLFRLAVIVQQIYKRYVEGKTRDKRFAQFGMFVQVLSITCEQVIGQSEL